MVDSGLAELVVVPPETNVHNVVEYCMARKYAPRWVNWFFGRAKQAALRDVELQPVGEPTFVTKTGHANFGGSYGVPVYFSWKYQNKQVDHK
ncbi:unnamed protein product [Amoebophrya sp. A25]|nr:unnamed protein product [Amoebophrya sp. A25]|eukprot:GSA25T00016948001.1